MKLETIKLDKALNQAYFKQSLKRADIELFKTNFKRLFERINETETEEHNKNIVSDFLKNTFYKDRYEINTAGRKDLAIHKGNTSQSPVSVIIEAKSPTNKAEMISLDKPNAKALHETIHYYLHERVVNQNIEIKHLIITNIYEWFIFDAVEFEKHFYANKTFLQQYKEWVNKGLAGTKTDWFYNEMAKPYVEQSIEAMPCVHINLADYAEIVKNADQTDDSKLINLYKILSPEHLLKLPFANDYNKIDTAFYNELLHILGLEETKVGGKKLITRVDEKNRHVGSLLENTINFILDRERLKHLDKPEIYGETSTEQVFSIALELIITWLNRILFLKLLEAQLVKYHTGNKDYLFLNYHKINDFDQLGELFFEVLAKRTENRSTSVNQKFGHLPYLNSSLFDISNLEDKIVFIDNLKDRLTIEVSKHTVLKDNLGNRRTGEMNTLEYLFAFLDAYSFASDSKAEIQDTERTIINAAVLGLIFEKINGYKDGSFYTPSFITMYMSRETLRRAVAQKFRELENKQIETFDDVKNYVARYFKKEDILRFNAHVNSLKIVDPAVGSGHFLVSALNELIAIKSELNILSDTEGKQLEYEVLVNNDELTIIHKHTNELFEYVLGADNQPPKQLQTAQVALFHEKQTLIENCLFGVDINPKSVLICRLRLWIELLKNAYYITPETKSLQGFGTLEGMKTGLELQTLPNIDINIKTGNSLISRFPLDSNLKQFAKSTKWTIFSYQNAVQAYKKTTDRSTKSELEKLIRDIKSNYTQTIQQSNPTLQKFYKLKQECDYKFPENGLFAHEPETEYGDNAKKRAAEKQRLADEIIQIKELLESEKTFFEKNNAFEWRFEFPEVLDENGDFVGFDMVIGNPPYVDIKELDNNLVKFLFSNYKTSSNRINLYSTFVEKAFSLLSINGYLSFIIPNSILMGSTYQKLRNLIRNEIFGIIKLPEKVFEDATVETVIIELKKNLTTLYCNTLAYKKDDLVTVLDEKLKYKVSKNSWNIYDEHKFNIYITENILKPLVKIHGKGRRLEEVADFSLGITPYDKYKGHSQELIEKKEFHSDFKLSEEYKPLIKGENIVPYYVDERVFGYIKYGSWLGAPRDERYFTEPRIIVRQIVSGNPPKIYAGYTDKSLYFTQIGFAIVPNSNITVFELLALLNSKLINFYHKYLFLDIEKVLFQKILIENCKLFPCKSFHDDIEVKQKVEQILNLKKADPKADTSALEAEIDQMVYALYELTPEEIAIVEGSVK